MSYNSVSNVCKNVAKLANILKKQKYSARILFFFLKFNFKESVLIQIPFYMKQIALIGALWLLGVGKIFAQSATQLLDAEMLKQQKIYKRLEDALQSSEKVYKLNLSQQNLSEVPKGLRKLRYLQALYLDYNALTALPAWIGELKNLQILTFSHNFINVLPTEIQQLKHLEIWLCSHNQFALLPAWVGKLQKLRTLAFTHNLLKTLPAEIGKLQNLESLYVGENLLETLPTEIGKLRNLQIWQVDSNRLKTLPKSITKLKKLNSVLLTHNLFTEEEKGKLRTLFSEHCLVEM
jgi:Leucine-rich repeat (LRR) protein